MFLSKVSIINYRGIKSLEVTFKKDINIIIGPNGSNKSAIIDAIRLFYSMGNQRRDISVHDEDFYVDNITGISESSITITYQFRDLSDKEKGALYEYLVISGDDCYAQATLQYTKIPNKYPKWTYYTGANPGQKADNGTFDIFQSYYLGALRDSTNDLLNTKYNILGKAIKRCIDRNSSATKYESILKNANEELLKQAEVTQTKDSINSHLNTINKQTPKIGLHIEQSKVDYIVNVIKPFLPFVGAQQDKGLSISQNSLGFNNLIYIATVLSDMSDAACEGDIFHFALLIEEPEAHLHPQLQLNLYKFLKEANCKNSCQLFITSHSPTLTSKIDLDNLIVLDSNKAIIVGDCFKDRLAEHLKQNDIELTEPDYLCKKNMLQRYLDVTRSQMFYANGILMIEGISEELLFSVFADIIEFKIEEKDIEIVQTGTSFYPYLLAFNSTSQNKKIEKNISICTDDDRYTDSKKPDYSFYNLLAENYMKLDELHSRILAGAESTRISNINAFKNGLAQIKLCKAYKTFEYEISFANIAEEKTKIADNLLFKYLLANQPDKYSEIEKYITTLNDKLSDKEKQKLAILTWKALPTKSIFAQDFAYYLSQNLDKAKKSFNVPQYIKDAFYHFKED